MKRRYLLQAILVSLMIVVLSTLGLVHTQAQEQRKQKIKAKRDLTIFALSDTHYGAGTSLEGYPKVHWINMLPGSKYPKVAGGGKVQKPRGVIMAGDLIDNGAVDGKYQVEWAKWESDFGVDGEGVCNFPVFECVGNHDVNMNRFVYDQVKERNKKRLELGYIDHVSENGYHYAWDWDGVRFINVNLFPGNVWHGEADSYGRGHDPYFSRDFLVKDLEQNVGDSGKPVIIVQHFRPIDENWWTHAAADTYHRVLQDYNVVLIMNGHQGSSLNESWRGINWVSSNGILEVFRVTEDKLSGLICKSENEWGGYMEKPIFSSYETSGLPGVVNNGNWATNISNRQAILSGKILYAANLPAKAEIFWGTTDGGDNPGAWEHNLKVGEQSKGSVFTASVEGLQPWSEYYYRTRISNKKGEAWAVTSIPFQTPGVMPKGWSADFIGYSQRAFDGAHYDNGVFMVRGSGRDIGEFGQPIDNFEFASTRAEGDVVFYARIDSMVGKTRYPKAGIMLRNTLDANSPNVALLYSLQGGLQLYARSEACGATAISSRNDIKLPVWVKLVREGSVFKGYSSYDGNTWEEVDKPLQIQMSDNIQAGLAVTGGNRDGSRHQTGTFSNVVIE